MFPVQACQDHGFFYLENHGIPEDVIKKVFDQSKAFFDLDLDVKIKVKDRRTHRGYKSFGSEMINTTSQAKGCTKVSSQMP